EDNDNWRAGYLSKRLINQFGKWSGQEVVLLIPGDIISIKLEDIVLADARLLEGDPLKIDQSTLTGKATHQVDSANNIGHFQNSIDLCHLRDDVKKRAQDIVANFID
ncbi:hypothetical protein Goshw_002390, partial [Gossypium schwendimanii]|nr:hypothetical protein [Gossypium schwendimanii]